MALSAATVYEVRTAGSDLNGGGYVTGASGSDFSQQDAAQYGFSDLVIDGATNTKVTSASHNFVATDVGNLLNIASGTGFTTGLFQIVSVASNAATLDKSAGTLGSTGGVFKVGGALATPGMAMATLVAGQTIYAKGGSSTTTNTANVAGGRLNFNVTGASTTFIRFIGYTTSRGDGGKYTLTLGATFTGPVVTLNNANSYNQVQNLAIVGTSTNTAKGFSAAGRSNRLLNIKVSGFSGTGDMNSCDSNAMLKDFEISGGATGTSSALNVSSAANISDGWIHGNAGRGVSLGGSTGLMVRVESTEHTGANGNGFFISGAGEFQFFDCAAWNNGSSDWILSGGNPTATCTRCATGGSGGYNWDNLTGPDSVLLYYCAAKTNTTALYRTTPNINVGLVTLTGDPFNGRTSGDFSPDNTANEGAALRGVAETIFGLTTTYADVGPAQHQQTASVVASNYGFA